MYTVPFLIDKLEGRCVVPQKELQKIHLIVNHAEKHKPVLVKIFS